jgi:hypothetical protein
MHVELCVVLIGDECDEERRCLAFSELVSKQRRGRVEVRKKQLKKKNWYLSERV